jgi:hypothetical protein
MHRHPLHAEKSFQVDVGLASFLSYEQVAAKIEICSGKKAFAQRDFIYFLRSLRRAHDKECREEGADKPVRMFSSLASRRDERDHCILPRGCCATQVSLSFEFLIQALRRNFNGIPADQFKEIVTTVVKTCKIELSVPSMDFNSVTKGLFLVVP